MRHFFFLFGYQENCIGWEFLIFFFFLGLSLRRGSVLARERDVKMLRGGFDVGAKLTLSDRERERNPIRKFS